VCRDEETLRCSLLCCRQVAILWCVHPAIPVGIAVARQRQQDHMPPSATKPDMKPPLAATCRQQKPLAPAPPEPQCSVADLVAAPAPPSLSAMGKLNSIFVCVKYSLRLSHISLYIQRRLRQLPLAFVTGKTAVGFNGTISCSGRALNVCSRGC
jgi:hypothetical protein